MKRVLSAIEKNNDQDLHLTLNSSRTLMLSNEYPEQFTKLFGKSFNSFNLRNIRLNMLDQSDVIVVVQTSKISNLTSLELGYNLKRSPQPLPMFFVLDKTVQKEPFESLQKDFPDLPIEILLDENNLENEIRRWAVESVGFKRRHEGKQGLTMHEHGFIDANSKEEGHRLGQTRISNVDVEGTKYSDRFENPENKNSPDLAKKATFYLKSGLSMTGYSFGAASSRSGEAVFQTSMVSYPEMLTDPSYKDQIIICSSVILGQYGVPPKTRDRYGLLQHFESEEIHCAGLIITDYSFNYSHFQAVQSLSRWLAQYNVPAIYGYEVDTRALILKIRETGSELAKIVQEGHDPSDVHFDDPNLRNLSAEVAVKKPVYYEGTGNFKVILVDFGVKNNIIRSLLDRSLSVMVVPWDYDYTSEQYDGIMLSNGPGDPRILETAITILKKQMKKDEIVPIFGVCMGNQILSCAAGAKIYKLSYGNRGHNQPVVDITTGKCYVTSQNHGYAVDHKTLPADWQAYFVNLNDHSNEGIRHVTKPYFSSQFHPEACGGPWDTRFLFDIFFKDIVNSKLYFGKKSMLKLIENPTFHLLPGQQIIDHTNADSRPFKMEFFEKRKKIKSVLIIGSGPLQIGQAGEFDYSGCQAIIAMKEEKITTILVNPNIATVQTRAEGMADKVYLVPLTVEALTDIIEKERPEGLLLGFGGQTALNLGIKLDKLGILQQYNVKVLGTSIATIEDTEDRELFNKRLMEINEPVAKSFAAVNTEEAIKAAHNIGYPVICRAAYALGGLGSGFAENDNELRDLCVEAFVYSPQVLIEKDLRGWKELEYEVVRDAYDNCITPAALENINPMGIHTGESIVITPLMTITDEEHFYLRRKAIKVVRHLGVVGECNIQFALNPRSHEVYIIEVNARLSRSSALASKATCYPLAYIAAKIALGYPLPKIPNIVTSITTSFFEPSLDYTVIKIPRWDLTKFNGVSRKIGSMMKSVGEIMAIGRNFEETIQKGLRMQNPNVQGFTWSPESKMRELLKQDSNIIAELKNATDNHIFAIFQALYQGWTIERISYYNKMDHWFLSKLERIVQIHKRIEKYTIEDLPHILLKDAKQSGFSDKQIALIIKSNEIAVRNLRKKFNIIPYTKKIDTLGGEFPCVSNNLYLSYNANKDEIDYQNNQKGVIVVGSGCYRIGSSVEFDWCGVELIKEIRESLKIPTIMINNNPETVSTDHTTCDKLYFEEISVERVLDIYEKENPHGAVISFGGQFPNNLAIPLAHNGVHILGTTAHSVDMAEDRAKFSQLCHDLNIAQPEWTEFSDIKQGLEFANKVGFPVILRPSYVLSGAAMRLVYNDHEFNEMLIKACDVSPDKPVVISRYIEDAMEVDFDGVAYHGEILVHAICQHIESAGIHSGDSSLVIPAPDINKDKRQQLFKIASALTKKLDVMGPFNIQFLYKDQTYQVIEMNLRASRSFPFISKVLGINFMNISARVLLDHKNAKPIECDPELLNLKHTGVKCPKFSYKRLAGSDPILGLEMASTGESGCIGADAFEALLKSLLSTDIEIPEYGNIIIVSEMERALKNYSLFFNHLNKKGYNFYYFLADSEGKPNEYDIANKLTYDEAQYMISSQKVHLAFSFARPSPAIFVETPQSKLRKLLFTYRIPTILDPNLAMWFSQALVNDAHKTIKYNISLQDYLGIEVSPKRRQRVDSGEYEKVDVLRQIMKNNNID
jgi:carbamoyl-phosphate synthase large subunit/carbamoyl-phosphate synthase small subunit